MPSEPIEYHLKGRIWYLHRDKASSVLLSLGRWASRMEKLGYTVEAPAIYPAESGGWSAWCLYQDPDELEVAA